MSREFDNQVAKEIFDLVPHECGSRDVWGPPFYSTDLDSAFEVEAWLFERGWRPTLHRRSDGKWEAFGMQGPAEAIYVTADTLPEAFCRVALEVARQEKEASNGPQSD